MAGKPGRSGRKFVAEAARMALLAIDKDDPEGRRYVHVIMHKLADLAKVGDHDATKILLRYAEAPPPAMIEDEDDGERQQREEMVNAMRVAKEHAREIEAQIIEGQVIAKGIEYKPAIPAPQDEKGVGVLQGRRDRDER